MNEVWLGLFSGIAFGFVVQRVGATDPDKITAGHLLEDPAIPVFMIMAVGLASLGILALKITGAGHFRVLPTSIVATGLAGLLFGIGWGIAGYCPGTSWAAVGEGRMDAIFALLGGLAGTFAFAHLHETLIPVLYLPTNLGQITLADWFGSATVGAWVLFAVLFCVAWVMGRLLASKTPA